MYPRWSASIAGEGLSRFDTPNTRLIDDNIFHTAHGWRADKWRPPFICHSTGLLRRIIRQGGWRPDEWWPPSVCPSTVPRVNPSHTVHLHELHVEANSRKIEQSLAQVNFPTVSFHVEIDLEALCRSTEPEAPLFVITWTMDVPDMFLCTGTYVNMHMNLCT
jgi:hypothetical protein